MNRLNPRLQPDKDCRDCVFWRKGTCALDGAEILPEDANYCSGYEEAAKEGSPRG